MIDVQGLHKRYGGRAALRGVDFSVPAGEIFGFVGPNGAGKTTTIRILATLTAADAGSATIGGIPVGQDPHGVRELIGYMPDFFGVYDRLTSEEYLEFYAACHGVARRRRRKVARDLLELVDLGDRTDDQVDTLSRGMKQRLCLARALVHDPQVLLLDEPASGLDPRARVEMRELIRELRRMGKTIFVSSHILPELEELCTWVGFIDDGRMVAAGPMADVRNQVRSGRRLRIELVDSDAELLLAAEKAIRGRLGVIGVDFVGDGLQIVVEERFADQDLLGDLIRQGIAVRSFAPVTGDLAEAFLRLTGPEVEA
ncbi:MAG: ABC transporter ATP-binding protein [Candidatus Nephthysia bennettiae]|uniref:ABC transporter ATP-binding protein n=1 Tax=Candidatus Nephthysia bennettiae TaxID=3127016 RepID=A0A934K9Q1_9BACT|nr:ABC transporter ATP-binding protein [Candidatus Dormibacteraeota bacterium]MBJ7614434.1 ABC transporter ATP-binding protein [Candidatus Dormibacteraeota bacterium]PZR87245.1 MAG: ABC transporter ATP-binding protein [Candidatus Dormibacteraeota bacterium]